ATGCPSVRLPNTSYLRLSLAGQKAEERRTGGLRRTRFAAAKLARKEAEAFRCLALGIEFFDHLAVIRRRAEEAGIEGQHKRRLGADRFCEVLHGNFRALRHAHLIEHDMRGIIVLTKLARQIEHVLGVAQARRSGVAVMTISSAESSTFFVQGAQTFGRSTTTQGTP